MRRNGYQYEKGSRYVCQYTDKLSEELWRDIPGIPMADNISGQRPRLETVVKACWSNIALHIEITCEDDFVKATFTERDDPLYEEDVVEVFIDEVGDGKRYIEIEVSPNNVVFDALIDHHPVDGNRVNTVWDAAGMKTTVCKIEEVRLRYRIDIPLTVFQVPPRAGTVWRVNFYRIDEDERGNRAYSAWSPTGAVNFHLPHCFGTFVFAGAVESGTEQL